MQSISLSNVAYLASLQDATVASLSNAVEVHSVRISEISASNAALAVRASQNNVAVLPTPTSPAFEPHAIMGDGRIVKYNSGYLDPGTSVTRITGSAIGRSNWVDLSVGELAGAAVDGAGHLHVWSTSNVSSLVPPMMGDGKALTPLYAPTRGDDSVPYPPAPLTGATTTLTGCAYGNGTYVVTASSSNGTDFPWRAFDKSDETKWTSVGSSATTTVQGVNVPGAWLQLELPSPIYVTSYSYRNVDVLSNRSIFANVGGNPEPWTLAGVDGRHHVDVDTPRGLIPRVPRGLHVR